MKRIFVISVFTVFIGLISACAFFYPFEVYNTVQRLRNETNDDGKDITPPSLIIQSPSGNITITSYSFTISGIVNDDSGIEGVYLIRNGLSPKKVNYTNMTWETNIANLAEGTNIIEVYAKDTLGNTSINHSVLIFVDTHAPTVLFELSSPCSTNVSPIDISGTATITNMTGVLITNVSFATNGGAYSTLTNGSSNVVEWSTNINLVRGTNTISVVANADNGKNSTNSIIVICDTNAPTVPVVSGDANSMNKTPTWSWNTVADAVKYRYSFVDESGWTETTDTNFTPSTNLAVGSINTLYVQAANILDNWSASGTNTIVVLPRFTEINSGDLTGVYNSSIDLGDIDGDTDLDLILTGENSSSVRVSMIYTNNGSGGFGEDISCSLTGVYKSSIKLGDIDGDGTNDLILTGRSGSGDVSIIYTNNGNGGFGKDTSSSLTGVHYSSIDLGDIDGDTNLDLILTGRGTDYVSMIYQNDGNGGFTEINPGSLTNVWLSSIDLGDIDGDGTNDLILTGEDSDNNPISKIYTNNGSGGFTEINPGTLTGVCYSSITLGDIDDDGDLDLILTGWTSSIRVSKIYKNNGSGFFTHSSSLTGVSSGSIDLGDIDDDGDLDLILTGWDGSVRVSKIYQNNGSGSFTEIDPGSLTGVGNSSIKLGDIDDDGDLDLILTGYTGSVRVSKIYRNNTISP